MEAKPSTRRTTSAASKAARWMISSGFFASGWGLRASSSCVRPEMTASRLLTWWAMPEAIWPIARSVSPSTTRVCVVRRSSIALRRRLVDSRASCSRRALSTA